VDEVANRPNTRGNAKDPSEGLPVMQSKNLAYVMFFFAAVANHHSMPPHFVEAGFKINTIE